MIVKLFAILSTLSVLAYLAASPVSEEKLKIICASEDEVPVLVQEQSWEFKVGTPACVHIDNMIGVGR